MEHVSAFTVFPDDGIRIDAHYIRRVTTYDGALLEEARPTVHDVLSPEVARSMVAMLADVVNFGTAVGAKALGRPSAGKTGTTNDFTDAWYMGFTPQLTTGVWVGFDDKQKSLGRSETGARAALPIWLEFMQGALAGVPAENFPNVVPLEKIALTKEVHVDTPDSAPTEGSEEIGGRGATPPKPPTAPVVTPPAAPPQAPEGPPPDPPPSTTAQPPPRPQGQ
jgi:penicillin-binding protein 1A